MNRTDEISRLRIRYRGFMLARKWKSATLVWARMHDLVNRQLRSEIRNAKTAKSSR